MKEGKRMKRINEKRKEGYFLYIRRGRMKRKNKRRMKRKRRKHETNEGNKRWNEGIKEGKEKE